MSCEQQETGAVILAAGRGTRMEGDLPKPLIPVAGRAMLDWVMSAVRDAGISNICLVVSRQLLAMLDRFDMHGVTVCLQEQQLGTGHALASALVAFDGLELPAIGDRLLVRGRRLKCRRLFICPGDVPAIRPETIGDFVGETITKDISLHVLGMRLVDPRGYGRIILSSATTVLDIIEEKDASSTVREVTLCNSGLMCVESARLTVLLNSLSPTNAQNEFYLPEIFAERRGRVYIVERDVSQFCGVNDHEQLRAVEGVLLAMSSKGGVG